METPPRDPPAPPLPGHPPAETAAASPLAVIVGAAVDLLSTTAFQFIYDVMLAMRLGDGGAFDQEQVERTLGLLPHRLTLYAAGGGMSVLGGFVAGRIARRNELWHGVAAGFLSVLIGKILSSSTPAVVSLDAADKVMNALATPLTIASAALGGFLAVRYRRR